MTPTPSISQQTPNGGHRVLNHEMKRNFICLIVGSEAIWNNLVNDEQQKQADYQIVVAKMSNMYPNADLTLEILKQQWKILRDCYRRERNLQMSGQKNIRWKYFNLLSFLEYSGAFNGTQLPVNPDLGLHENELAVVLKQRQLEDNMEKARRISLRFHHLITDPNSYPTEQTEQELLQELKVKEENDVSDLFSGYMNETGYDHQSAHVSLMEFLDQQGASGSPQDINVQPEAPPPVENKPSNNAVNATTQCLQAEEENASRKRRRLEPSTPTFVLSAGGRLDKFDILGHMVTQTLREMSSLDHHSTEESYLDIEQSLMTLRRKCLKKMSRGGRDEE